MPDVRKGLVAVMPRLMVSKRTPLPLDVVTAARTRIVNAFSNGVPVYLSTSGGKDSIVLMHLVHELIRSGEVDPSLLTVIFIDEEAMYDDAIAIVEDWRRRFLLAGAKFRWYCIEVKHFNCFNMLTNDESFICWDSTKRDVWVRPMPAFAITDHPMLKRREDTYQDFLNRILADGISMTGVRVAESIQRRKNFRQAYTSPKSQLFQPIYDWKDTDVWRYIKDHDLDFPQTYMHLYQIGLSRREMRISQFFSVDTAKSLVQLNEYEPGLMERVIKREPNAYLASLYWETEMFRRAGGRGQGSPNGDEKVDWKAKALEKFRDPEIRASRSKERTYRAIRRFLMLRGQDLDEGLWRDVYNTLVAGDPKGRNVRAMYNQVAKPTRGR